MSFDYIDNIEKALFYIFDNALSFNLVVNTAFLFVLNNFRAFDLQTVDAYTRRNLKSFEWKHYYRYKDIYNWLKDLHNLYPKKTELIKFGKTYEGRDLVAFKINLSLQPRSTIIIEGGIHAREWISPAVVTYLINSILNANENETNSDLVNIANAYEWYFVPVLNPDGYEYTHKVVKHIYFINYITIYLFKDFISTYLLYVYWYKCIFFTLTLISI